MSEYQYYEFRALDRPLTAADQKALRAISTRAEITASSFTNHYEWGDLKGDPSEWMDRWFDLHLYFSNWGTRVLMIRLPRRLFDAGELRQLVAGIDAATLRTSGDHLVLEIQRQNDDPGVEEWYDYEEESERLAGIAPIRGELLAGDLRLFSLLWLMSVEVDLLEGEPLDDVAIWDDPAAFDLLAGELEDEGRLEPAAGLGPLTPALEAVATFFSLNGDLLQAAAERPYAVRRVSSEDVRRLIAGMPDADRVSMLTRVYENDPLVAAELRRAVGQRGAPSSGPSGPAPRTASGLVGRARQFRDDRRRAEEERVAAEERKQARDAAHARKKWLDELRSRGESVWFDIEAEIERRNAGGYDRATALLLDVRTLAEERGDTESFVQRVEDIRRRHDRKPRFIERIADL